MQQPVEIDDHTAEYWARQVRIGASIAAGVGLLGGIRAAFDWSPARRRLVVPILVAALGQGASVFLPWSRLIRRRALRQWLVLW
ncbi:MAG: hypothetical protein ABW000_06325 [Actinoplanes sp.]